MNICRVHIDIFFPFDRLDTMASEAPPPTKRGASFSELEQVNLTHAWIEISLDPIHGADQKGADFYKKIAEKFEQKMGTQYTKRSPESLHSHWRDTIQYNVAKFSSAYAKATSRDVSGYSPDDYIRDAQVLFMAENKTKKPFKAMKCWEILKSHAKWSPGNSVANSDCSIEGPPTVDRPVGCHKAKKAKTDAKAKGKFEESKSNQLNKVIEAFGSSHRERQILAKKSFEMMEKRNALKELKFFETDKSEEGMAIAKQLRVDYMAKYFATTPVVATSTPGQTFMTPLIDVSSLQVDTSTIVPVDMFSTMDTTNGVADETSQESEDPVVQV